MVWRGEGGAHGRSQADQGHPTHAFPALPVHLLPPPFPTYPLPVPVPRLWKAGLMALHKWIKVLNPRMPPLPCPVCFSLLPPLPIPSQSEECTTWASSMEDRRPCSPWAAAQSQGILGGGMAVRWGIRYKVTKLKYVVLEPVYQIIREPGWSLRV